MAEAAPDATEEERAEYKAYIKTCQAALEGALSRAVSSAIRERPVDPVAAVADALSCGELSRLRKQVAECGEAEERVEADVASAPAEPALPRVGDLVHANEFEPLAVADWWNPSARRSSRDTSGGLWTDPQFGPGPAALCGHDFSRKPQWRSFVWRRASDVFPGATLFKGISPNDIFQGHLGDCYLLAALSCLAEVPGRIESIFVGGGPSAPGRYTLRFAGGDLGSPIEVDVDDWIPCVSESGGPAFSKSPSGELWVVLAEKAYAKLHGSYLAIEAGRTGSVLGDITGAPHVDVQWRQNNSDLGHGDLDLDDTWAKLVDADRKGWPIAISMPAVRAKDMEREWGLVEEHAYTVLQARELDGVRLLQLRNPWGKGEWKGEWSDHDAGNWTAARRSALLSCARRGRAASRSDTAPRRAS